MHPRGIDVPLGYPRYRRSSAIYSRQHVSGGPAQARTIPGAVGPNPLPAGRTPDVRVGVDNVPRRLGLDVGPIQCCCRFHSLLHVPNLGIMIALPHTQHSPSATHSPPNPPITMITMEAREGRIGNAFACERCRKHKVRCVPSDTASVCQRSVSLVVSSPVSRLTRAPAV
jgi:hypothetical protein